MSGIHEVRGAIQGKGYVIVRPLVEGAEAVFEARHDRIAGTYVVRLFPSDISPRSEAALRIHSGARLATLLRHPGIVQVLDFNVAGEEPAFVVMEHVEGHSLEEVLAKDGMFPLPMAIDLVGQIGDALRASHALGIIHGDLHPGAIRLTHDRNGKTVVKVLGFGWAKELRAAGRKTAGRSSCLAPEQQAKGGKSVDERADQFSLAAIAYEMLAGCSHVNEESDDDLADPDARGDRKPPPLAELVLGLPPGLDDVLRRALSFDPRERFPRLQDFASALQRVTDSKASLSAGSSETTWEWPGSVLSDAAAEAVVASPTPGPVAIASELVAGVSGANTVAAATLGQGDETPPPQVMTIAGATELGTSSLRASLDSTMRDAAESGGESVARPLVDEAAFASLGQVTPPPTIGAPSPAHSSKGQGATAEGTPRSIEAAAAAVVDTLLPDDRTPPLLVAEAKVALSAGGGIGDVPTPPPVTGASLLTARTGAIASTEPPTGSSETTLPPLLGGAPTPPPVSFPVMTISAPDDMNLIGVPELIAPGLSKSVPTPQLRARTRVVFLVATVGVVVAAITVMSGMRKAATVAPTPEVATPSLAASKAHPPLPPAAAVRIAAPLPSPGAASPSVAATAEVAPAAAPAVTPPPNPAPVVVPSTASTSASATTTTEVSGERARSLRGHARRTAAHSASARRDRRR